MFRTIVDYFKTTEPVENEKNKSKKPRRGIGFFRDLFSHEDNILLHGSGILYKDIIFQRDGKFFLPKGTNLYHASISPPYLITKNNIFYFCTDLTVALYYMNDLGSKILYIFKLLDDLEINKIVVDKWFHEDEHCYIDEVCIHPLFVDKEPHKKPGIELTFLYDDHRAQMELTNVYSINIDYLRFCVENNIPLRSDFKLLKSVMTKYQYKFNNI